MNHVRESQVGGFGIEARAFVAHECVLSRVELDAVVYLGGAQTALNRIAAFAGDVGIACAKDHKKLTADI